MGQKVNPNGLRIGVIGDWSSHWYSEKQQFADCLIEDQKIREFVMKAIDPIARKNSKKPVDEARSNVAFVSKVIVDRKGADNIRVTIKTARFPRIRRESSLLTLKLSRQMTPMHFSLHRASLTSLRIVQASEEQ